MMLASMVKIPWLHFRGGGGWWGILEFTPHAGWTQENNEKKLIVGANLGWQEKQSLTPL